MDNQNKTTKDLSDRRKRFEYYNFQDQTHYAFEYILKTDLLNQVLIQFNLPYTRYVCFYVFISKLKKSLSFQQKFKIWLDYKIAIKQSKDNKRCWTQKKKAPGAIDIEFIEKDFDGEEDLTNG